jgi:hypothetical protein
VRVAALVPVRGDPLGGEFDADGLVAVRVNDDGGGGRGLSFAVENVRRTTTAAVRTSATEIVDAMLKACVNAPPARSRISSR